MGTVASVELPTAQSLILRFTAGTLAAILVAVVGGYFVLRSVAIDEAKRERGRACRSPAQLVEASVGDGLLTATVRPP